MSAIMEKNIPAGASEILLKIAGKCCDRDIRVTSFIRTEKGTFKPSENTLTFDFSGLSATPRFIEIANITPTTTVNLSEYTSVSLVPITHAAWIGALTKNEFVAPTGVVEYPLKKDEQTYKWGSNYVSAELKDGKITFTIKEGLPSQMFEKNVTYEWTAYYWDK